MPIVHAVAHSRRTQAALGCWPLAHPSLRHPSRLLCARLAKLGRRLIGMAERSLELACARADARVAFGKPLAQQGVVQQQIAESRCEIDQARLLTLHTARMIDVGGAKHARREIAMIKAVAPLMALRVIDRCMQIHGGMGVSGDTPMAHFYASARSLRLADGPDEVHLASIAKAELKVQRAARE